MTTIIAAYRQATTGTVDPLGASKAEKMKLILILGISLLINVGAIIYGEDNFIEIEDVKVTDIDWVKISKSVGVIVPKKMLIKISANSYKIDNFKLNDEIENLTKEHRFQDQPAIGIGTIFLVSENQMVTAGHLVKDLRNSVILFDYEWSNKGKKIQKEVYNSDEIYELKKVVKRCNSRRGDYALIEINSFISDRKPLKLKKLNPTVGESLKMISTPDGTPLKLTSKGVIWEKDPKLEGLTRSGYFIHNLDNSGGSSGAPIFDSITGEVIGIQSGGDDNFVNKNGTIVQVKGDEKGENTNINRKLSGEYGSIIPNKLIDKINSKK